MIRTMQDTDRRPTIVIGVLIFLLIAAIAVAGWAIWQYMQERDTVDAQIEAAVEEALAEQQEELEAEFEEERKYPFRTYEAPSVLGPIAVDIPDNWNRYVEESDSGNERVDLYAHPENVTLEDGDFGPLAFRMQVLDEFYEDATSDFRSDAEDGELTASTVTVSDIEGDRFDGVVRDDFEGSLVALPYRDRTILLWTESERFIDDFDDILEQADIQN